MKEVHHLQKLDAPSGTAISLAEQLIEKKLASNWTIDPNDLDLENLKIEVVREEGIPGTHEIKYDSEVDDIVIRHTAHNRKGFALGAVIASEWIQNKSGVFSMRDVLNL
jgi:4-hydroxy-tetrahydrodipicolinate reductase